MTFRIPGVLLAIGAVAAVAALAAGPARGQAPSRPHEPSAVEERWRESFEAFAAADRAQAPAPGGVVFVGSSSIRLWSGLETQFEPSTVVLKRGFGGSRLSDCARYLADLVLPYKPRLVVVYAGDNDLADGRTPQQVLESFRSFVSGVHEALPETRIAYLSIKPSPLRAALLPAMREANALIEAYSRDTRGLDYIDVHSKMLDGLGNPRDELFLPDRLHLNAQGYALWKTVISGHLR